MLARESLASEAPACCMLAAAAARDARPLAAPRSSHPRLPPLTSPLFRNPHTRGSTLHSPLPTLQQAL
eukprot:1714813-Rhodomonas_salina.1